MQESNAVKKPAASPQDTAASTKTTPEVAVNLQNAESTSANTKQGARRPVVKRTPKSLEKGINVVQRLKAHRGMKKLPLNASRNPVSDPDSNATTTDSSKKAATVELKEVATKGSGDKSIAPVTQKSTTSYTVTMEPSKASKAPVTQKSANVPAHAACKEPNKASKASVAQKSTTAAEKTVSIVSKEPSKTSKIPVTQNLTTANTASQGPSKAKKSTTAYTATKDPSKATKATHKSTAPEKVLEIAKQTGEPKVAITNRNRETPNARSKDTSNGIEAEKSTASEKESANDSILGPHENGRDPVVGEKSRTLQVSSPPRHSSKRSFTETNSIQSRTVQAANRTKTSSTRSPSRQAAANNLIALAVANTPSEWRSSPVHLDHPEESKPPSLAASPLPPASSPLRSSPALPTASTLVLPLDGKLTTPGLAPQHTQMAATANFTPRPMFYSPHNAMHTPFVPLPIPVNRPSKSITPKPVVNRARVGTESSGKSTTNTKDARPKTFVQKAPAQNGQKYETTSSSASTKAKVAQLINKSSAKPKQRESKPTPIVQQQKPETTNTVSTTDTESAPPTMITPPASSLVEGEPTQTAAGQASEEKKPETIKLKPGMRVEFVDSVLPANGKLGYDVVTFMGRDLILEREINPNFVRPPVPPKPKAQPKPAVRRSTRRKRRRRPSYASDDTSSSSDNSSPEQQARRKKRHLSVANRSDFGTPKRRKQRNNSTHPLYLSPQKVEWHNFKQKSSNVGPLYQVPSLPSAGDFDQEKAAERASELSMKVWDCKLADEAEDRGEDIEGFIGRMTVFDSPFVLSAMLHSNGYSVEKATVAMNEFIIQGLPDEWNPFSHEEIDKFSMSMMNHKKDFPRIAKILGRSGSSCLHHYYNKFKKVPAYSALKNVLSEESDDYCDICDDGGTLICCESCKRWFHPACVTPPLQGTPVGDWFCPTCERTRGAPSSVAKRCLPTDPTHKL